VFTAINNQNIMTLLIRIFVTVVVALGIASVLVVSVVQKRKEIGILRAIGATRAQMLRVFLLQGAIVGILGALAGSALGLALVSFFSRVLRSASGTPLFTLEFDVHLIGIFVASAAVLGLIAAVLPARNAADLDPAQAIRGCCDRGRKFHGYATHCAGAGAQDFQCGTAQRRRGTARH
jgi:lipoprotein-releasing system permease protein